MVSNWLTMGYCRMARPFERPERMTGWAGMPASSNISSSRNVSSASEPDFVCTTSSRSRSAKMPPRPVHT